MSETKEATNKSKQTVLLLAIFAGTIGADRFYQGKIGTGILKLCTLGGLGIWWLIDIIIIASKSEEELNTPQDKKAKQKQLAVGGIYYSSHPDIHGQEYLELEFGELGVTVTNGKRKNKRILIKELPWDQIISFEKQSSDERQMSSSQRVTATRLATVGVFALAAPKKKEQGRVKGNFYYVLHTTTGDIELEKQIDSGNTGGGSMGKMTRDFTEMNIKYSEVAAGNAKRYVAEHAKAPTR
jgi:hypothetical protein